MSKIEFQDFFNIHKFTYTDKKTIDKMKLEPLSNNKKNNAPTSDKNNDSPQEKEFPKR